MIGMIDKVENDPNKPIDLRVKETSTLSSTVLEIPLTCLMAKVKFNIVVNPVQVSDFTQRFELKSWVVENAPTQVRLSQPTGTNESAHSDGPFISAATFSTVDNGSNMVMEGASTPMSFWCYVPEQRVYPSGSVSYPSGVTAGDVHSQNYKPNWLTDADKPIKITLNGVYTDHRGLEKAVTYTVYPGADNYKDFYINRNGEYINNISILGISNSKYGDEGTISVDWRVDVKQNDFKFELERETLLDSHWEIRPIRITLDPLAHPSAHHIEVQIMGDDPNDPLSNVPGWIRMEMPSTSDIDDNPSLYCDVASAQLAYGKRRYFTTDLVTSDLSGGTTISFNAGDTGNSGITNEHVIWVYVDENITGAPASGSNTRQAKVQCRYYEKKSDGAGGYLNEPNPSPTVTEDYFFIQKSLHNIKYGEGANEHTYGIEYYEEYLYNFDSRDDFTALPDGMAWGLNGLEVSSDNDAIIRGDFHQEGGLLGAAVVAIFQDAIANSIASIATDYGARYDFYLDRDKKSGYNIPDGLIQDRQGLAFTKKIARAGIAQNYIPNTLETNSSPQSAVEYCLNKNKRKSDGTIDISNIHWYLPSIDEIEDVTMGGYETFEVFQDKLYWSSQPAYKEYGFEYIGKYRPIVFTCNYGEEGYYYLDHPNRARATKVVATGNVSKPFENEYSGSTGIWGTLTFNKSDGGTISNTPATPTPPVDNESGVSYQAGNLKRSDICRIRCCYK